MTRLPRRTFLASLFAGLAASLGGLLAFGPRAKAKEQIRVTAEEIQAEILKLWRMADDPKFSAEQRHGFDMAAHTLLWVQRPYRSDSWREGWFAPPSEQHLHSFGLRAKAEAGPSPTS